MMERDLSKYNDTSDYRAKVLAECDDPACDHNQPDHAASIVQGGGTQ